MRRTQHLGRFIYSSLKKGSHLPTRMNLNSKNIFNRNGNGRREAKGFEFREIITVQNERKLEDQQTKNLQKTNLQDNFPAEVIRKPAHFCMMGKFWPNFCKQSVMGGEIPRGGLLSSF